MTVRANKTIEDAGFAGGAENNPTEWIEPSAFIQWKGTDVCMDFHCDCGAFCHFDGDFAYFVKCPHCGALWQMPYVIYPRRGEGMEYSDNPKILEPDGNYCDDDGNPHPVNKVG